MEGMAMSSDETSPAGSLREKLIYFVENNFLEGRTRTESREMAARMVDEYTREYAHELAELVRNRYGKPRWPGEEPEYAYGYNAATHDAADLIDPDAESAVRVTLDNTDARFTPSQPSKPHCPDEERQA